VFKKRESAVRNSTEETSLLLSSRRATITEWKAWLNKIKHFFLSPPNLPPCQDNSPENFAMTRDRKDNRPYISAKVYGKSISGLLDTGACHSVIGSKGNPFIDSLGISVQVPQVSKLATVDATIHTVSGVVYLPIEIDSCIREVPFYLVPSFPNYFIFGSDFFDLFSLSVRKKDNKWLVKISNHQISSIDNTGTDQSNSKTHGTVDPIVEDVEISPGDRNCYAAELTSLKIIFNEVRHKLHRAYVRYSDRYNLDRQDVQFEVGQKVWRRNKVLSDQARGYTAKLAPRYVLCQIRRLLCTNFKMKTGLTQVDGTSRT
jgi:hypothetical protein